MSQTDAPLVAVYADEACIGNGREGENPGGAGGLIEILDSRRGTLERQDFWISEPATTNNRMALRSSIEAFRALSGKGNRFRVLFTSDSQYLVEGMRTWVHQWAARDWKRKGGALENRELWLEAVEAARPHSVQWKWVRGHAAHPQNEYADRLATRAARSQTSSDGTVRSEFESWLARERAAGRMSLEPDPLPTGALFRPDPPLPLGPAASLFDGA